eukprot:3719546-Pleurochrysis_carterae.AAC.1
MVFLHVILNQFNTHYKQQLPLNFKLKPQGQCYIYQLSVLSMVSRSIISSPMAIPFAFYVLVVQF